MGHPFIGNLSDKTLEELSEVINSLNNKLVYAYRTNNTALINQLQLAIASYRDEFQRQQAELWDKRQAENKGKISII